MAWHTVRPDCGDAHKPAGLGMLSCIVTVVALPFVIGVFLFEQRKGRENEKDVIWKQISDAYIDLLEVVPANPYVRLRSQTATPNHRR